MEKTTILAIETSCDETGVAVLRKEGEVMTVLAEAVASQVDIHVLTGGVVPEVAAREHVKVITPLIENVTQKSKVKMQNYDAIAVTVGPGLIPALAVGVQAARTLAYAWNKPIVPVHHIEGHIYSALLSAKQRSKFPALALIVSGGHTMLILIRDHLQYEVIGQTRDDAAGEAFDKVARLLKLPYPGGPHLSKLAEQGNRNAFDFPRPMMHSDDFDFSFSGLKTAVLYTLRELMDDHYLQPSLKLRPAGTPAKLGLSREALAKWEEGKKGRGTQVDEEIKKNLAASFQQAVVDVLTAKTKRAAEKYQPKTILLAGGVAANKQLRRQLQMMTEEVKTELRIAPLNLCGDNGVMIGQVGLLAFEQGRAKSWRDIDAQARVPIESFN